MSDEKVEHAVKLTLEQWDRLGVVDTDNNGPLLPSVIRTRAANGSIKTRECMLMMVDRPRAVRARTFARGWAHDLGIDARREADPVTGGGQDRDLVRELEMYCELAFAIRDATPPYDQSFPDGKSLWNEFKTIAPLSEIYARLDMWTRLNDAGYGELSPDQVWETIAKLARDGNALPLAELDGTGQLSCIIVSARAAMRSPTCPSRLRWPSVSGSDTTSLDPTQTTPSP